MPDAPLKTLFFVATEVVADLFVKNSINGVIALIFCAIVLLAMLVFDQCFDTAEVSRVICEPDSHVFDRKNKIDYARGNRGIRHAWLQWTCAVTSLGQRQTAAFFDCFDPERAVAAASGKKNTDGGFAMLLSERA